MKDALLIPLKIGVAWIVEITAGLIYIPIRIIGGFFAFGFAAYGLLRLVMYLTGN